MHGSQLVRWGGSKLHCIAVYRDTAEHSIHGPLRAGLSLAVQDPAGRGTQEYVNPIE
jgi:hypothetical protein